MSSDDLADFLTVHSVSVETYQGKAGNGTLLYAAPVTVDGFLSRKQTFVRDANGEQVISSSTFSADAAQADTFAPKSRVTIGGQAQPTTVIARQVSDGGALVDGLARVKAFLQ